MFRICVAAFWLLVLPVTAAADVAGKIRVIDGDTFDIGGTTVRLFGIDAPEQDQTCTSARGDIWRCGAWVTETVRARYEGARARCVPLDRDRYGRTVARCFVSDADLGQRLVIDGLAFAYRKFSMDYDFDEKGAAVRGAGLHSSRVEAPATFRQSRVSVSEAARPTCTIKGNINSKGQRIYHMPGQRDYDRTDINGSRGERWFCSAAEAEAAGWRAALR